ncbi:MAG: DUF4258 domain-containing protein [Candidatus Edwardsbacteria bacterium]|nr:DUF4258 domain-containing protein [Candidatus Edwardsbacteria bacterium]
MIEIDGIREHVARCEYYFSKHGDQERQNDDLTIKEVEEALVAGLIIEHYADTGRGESCLVAGFTRTGIPIHVVCGLRGDWLAIITVYIPKPPKFKSIHQRGEP